MIFREAKLSDLDQIAKLHQQTLRTASAYLGENYLKNNYKQIISDNKTNLVILACKEKKVIGVITASLDLRKTIRALSMRSFDTLALITKKILFKPSLVFEFINHIYLEIKILHKYPTPYQTILTLFVSNDYQGLGVGRKLTKKMIQKLKSRKVKRLYVDTQKSNKIALSFYKKMGFKIEDQIADSTILTLTLIQ